MSATPTRTRVVPTDTQQHTSTGSVAAGVTPEDDAFTLRIPRPRRNHSEKAHRSAIQTTEFWMTLALVAGVLAATYLARDTLDRVDGWRFATWAVMAYVISRGLAKLGRRDDAGDDRGDDNREVDLR